MGCKLNNYLDWREAFRMTGSSNDHEKATHICFHVWCSSDSWLICAMNFSFADWITEWQVIVGIAMLVIPALCVCCFMAFKWYRGEDTSQVSASNSAIIDGDDLQQDTVHQSIWVLWESAAMQIMIYGTLKHSPAVAMIAALLYTFLRSFFLLAVSDSKAARKSMRASQRVQRLIPVSIYTDIHYGTLFQLLPVFTSQAMLFGFIMLSMWDEKPLKEGRPLTMHQVWMYMCGTVVSVVVRMQLQNFQVSEYDPFWGPYFKQGFKHPHHWAYLRVVLSWIVNSLLSSTTVFILPAILMRASNNLEFVKDATAVLFIAELDQMLQFGEERAVPMFVKKNDDAVSDQSSRSGSKDRSDTSSDKPQDLENQDDPYEEQRLWRPQCWWNLIWVALNVKWAMW